jgi:DNA-binding helix-hairpin-helix protein with protein kinase domain
MPTLYDPQGCAVEAGTPLAAGGEGTVFTLPGDPARLAKVYHQRPDATKVDKLRWMARQASPALCKFTAWPTATLHDAPGGPLIGFLMLRFDGYRPLHTLYSPAHRRATFPEADWAFLVTAAMNCAAAFDAVHEQGHVIGDVNQSNVLVSRQALACLIDCDSFQVNGPNRVFRCEVGVGPYTPPELQTVNFRQVDRTANHDRFGLAVLVFHLLFMGRHPFAGRFLGPGDLSLEQAIAEYRFVYSQVDPETKMVAPPFSLPLRAVGPRLSGLFERAFTRGSEKAGARPATAEWYAALNEFRSQLRTCPRDAGHKVPPDWVECPWCGFRERGGPNFFLGVGLDGVSFQVDAALLNRLWDEAQAMKPQTFPLPALVLPPATPPPPTRRDRAGQRLVRVPIAYPVSLVSWWGLAWLLVAWLVAPSTFWGTFFSFLFCLWITSPLYQFLLPRLLRFEKGLKNRCQSPATVRAQEAAAQVEQLQALNDDWGQTVDRYTGEFRRLKDVLRGIKKEIGNLQNAFLDDRYGLEKMVASRQAESPEAVDPVQEAAAREHFLRNSFLSDHKIPGFGSGRLTLLASYGIETAFDLTEEDLKEVRGIGPKLRRTLLDWRTQRLQEYRYDPKAVAPGTRLAQIPPEEMKALVLKYKQREEQLRSQLQKAVQDLTSLTRHVEQELQELASRRHAVAARAVALGVDMSKLGM